MKDIPIKFRGKSAVGEVYGFYVEREGKPYIVNEFGTMTSVDEESVSQLVGYDDEGKEIYEYEHLTLYNQFGHEIWEGTVKFKPNYLYAEVKLGVKDEEEFY